MTIETTTWQAKAQELADSFTTDTRLDGKPFVKCKDGTAEWIQDAIYAAHGDMMPDDWVYATCASLARLIVDRLEDGETLDILEDQQGDIVDGLVDVYTSSLTEWLNSHVYRVGYCDMANEEFGYDGFPDATTAMQRGQYWEIDQIFGALVNAIREASDGS